MLCPAGCEMPEGMPAVLRKCFEFEAAKRPTADQLVLDIRQMAAPYLGGGGPAGPGVTPGAKSGRENTEFPRSAR